MLDVFDLPPSDYAISDESELADFVDVADIDTSETWHRIGGLNGLERDAVGSERLVEILSLLSAQQRSR
jgi:hypothetical protein